MNSAISPAVSYVSTAFYWQYNLILLGGSALFSLASASPWPLLLGVTAEAAWLGLGSRLPGFRRSVNARLDAERRARLEDEIVTGMRKLGPEHSSRLLGVGQALSQIELNATGAAEPGSEVHAVLVELEGMRLALLSLCLADERLARQLDELARNPPEQEVARLSQAYAAERDLGARFTLHQGIKLAQLGVEQRARRAELRQSIERKLAYGERVLAHLRQQQQLGTSGAAFAAEARACLQQLGSAPPSAAELRE